MADEKHLDDESTEMATPYGEKDPWEEEETPLPQRAVLPAIEEIEEDELTPIPQTGLVLGSIRDRFASGVFDLLVLGYLYLGFLLAYNFIVWRQFLRPIPVQGTHAYLFHSLYLLFAFLYFFIAEGVFFTSLGKFFARLSVRRPTGEGASLMQVALRNILRPLDYLLSVSPTWMLLEKLPRRQRLGDLLAGTLVTKHLSRAPRPAHVSGKTASATLRLLAGAIDFCFSAAFVGGFALFIDYKRPVFSFLIVSLLPLVYLAWHLAWEGLFKTTAGLWIFGCKITTEEGAPIGFTEAMIRALFRVLDTNPFGWSVLFMSSKNQRPSDLAAATVVVHDARPWKTLIGIGVSLVLIAAIWFAGLVNPRNYLTPFFKADFLAKVFSVRVGGGVALPASQGLLGKRFNYLSPDRKTPRPSAEFKPGETIYFSFDITGFAVRDNEGWIQEDLVVRYPDQAIGFKQENIVDFHQLLKNPEVPLEIMNTLALPPNAQPGHYTLVIVLHDRFANRHLTEQRTFLVTP